MKLGSLFDGSGTAPLAAVMCGIEPSWASEVEPYPIAVTRTHIPTMKHLGSVTDINGTEIEPVDIITFGSPCQDMSIAGKRAGIKHESNGDEETTRSGLFMEAIRIIKEMREATNGVYPRFAVWENVPGAFSSNKGEDFRLVLEEFVKVKEPSAVMPAVPAHGWPYADSYCGDGWSLAYRVFDAQFWGVPQRRRRIYLVADFAGQRAGEILFKRPGLRGYFETGRTPWKDTAAHSQRSVGADDSAFLLKIRSGCEGGGKGPLVQEERSATLATNNDQYLFQPMAYGISSFDSNSMKSSNPHSGIYEAETSRTLDLNGGSPACNQGGIAIVDQVMLDDQGGQQINVRNDGISPTLRAEMHGHPPCVACMASSAVNAELTDGTISPTLMARAGTGGNQLPLVACHVKCTPPTEDAVYDIGDRRRVADVSEHVSPTLTQKMGTGGNNVPVCVCYDTRGNGDGVTVPTITGDHENRVTDYTAICIQGNSIDRADTAGCNGKGYKEDVCYTLNTIDRHAVVFCEKAATLSANDGPKGPSSQQLKNPEANFVCEKVYGLDRASFNQGKNAKYGFAVEEELAPTIVAKGPGAVAHSTYSSSKASFFTTAEKELANTLMATDYKDPPIVNDEYKLIYIVRRLTPVECARLQGFPDWWGEIEQKDEFTEEEYQFWLKVRQTHDAINGRAEKQYTSAQMLTWYNKLHTDSAEYKLWGNGMALPNMLYVMQGIAEAVR